MISRHFTGTLRSWDRTRGFGFLTRDQNLSDVFVHSKQISRSGLTAPVVGDRYSFFLMIAGNSQVQACDLKRLCNSDEPVKDGFGASPATTAAQPAVAGIHSEVR